MKKIYFAGKFNLKKDDKLTLVEKLVDDFRAKVLGSAKRLTYADENIKLNDKYLYSGPFYCEKASDGDFTSTDCNVVLNAEFVSVENCDIFLALFDENFSVGTIVELGWAIDMNKDIIICYKEERSKYQIKSDYWFAIADAIKRSNKVKVYSFSSQNEIVDKIRKDVLDYEI